MTMMIQTLEDLILGVEKQAGLNKQASEAEDEKKENPFAKKDGEGKEEKKEDKDGEGKEEKKDDKMDKSAAFKSGSDLAREVMEKVASLNNNTTNTYKGDTDMNKQASEAGKALAQALLKQAGVGDTNTANGIMPGVVPHKSLVDQATQKAEHDAIIQPTPGTDGLGNGGTVNQIFDAIVADAMARGVKDEQITGGFAAAEGAQVAQQAPNQVQQSGPGALGGDDHEKTAAVHALVDNGYDFDQAVELVKAASDMLEQEEETHIKQAAFNELLSNGIAFDEAVEMVKQASQLPVPRTSLSQYAGKSSNRALKIGAGIAGAAAAGAGAAALIKREKKAAMDHLLDNGIDFETAAQLVAEKSQELYGA